MTEELAIAVGAEGSAWLTVGGADTALAWRSGDVPVLATPRLLALAEEAAVCAVREHLRPDRTTVGSWVELAHLAPTRVGATVAASARLSAVDGSRLEFDFEVTEDGDAVARGRHVRVVVDRARFA